ncbi:phosphatase [Sinorhizobium medicae]|nr:phosphatase [Sinorhizobium medicae]
MKIWIVSDLHLEFGNPFSNTIPPDADVLVCAGDVLTKGVIPTIQWFADTIASDVPVVFVGGNHEFYGASIKEGIRDGREFAARFSNIHFLENERVDIGEVRFVGCTLWTDFRLGGRDPAFAMEDVAKGMNDYKRIKHSKRPYQKFKPIHALRKHQESRTFIASELSGSEGKTMVVVTHHAPSVRSIPRWGRDDPVVSAYASSLEPLILQTQPALWIHGHIHEHREYRIGDTLVLSNPRGYPGERTGFDPGFTIDV